MRRKVFFIHIFKNMGTTIYSFLTEKYRKKFYGVTSIKDYEKRNNIVLTEEFKALFKHRKEFSFDHIDLDTLLLGGIIKKEWIPFIDCICIIREPIERFISMCNYRLNKHPNETIEDMIELLAGYTERKEKFTEDHVKDTCCRTQCSMINLKHDWNIIKLKFDNKKEIENTFKRYGINMDLSSKYENVSKKKYSVKDITPEQLEFLQEYFKEDIELYNSL